MFRFKLLLLSTM